MSFHIIYHTYGYACAHSNMTDTDGLLKDTASTLVDSVTWRMPLYEFCCRISWDGNMPSFPILYKLHQILNFNSSSIVQRTVQRHFFFLSNTCRVKSRVRKCKMSIETIEKGQLHIYVCYRRADANFGPLHQKNQLQVLQPTKPTYGQFWQMFSHFPRTQSAVVQCGPPT
jgi:hypothetical protein